MNMKQLLMLSLLVAQTQYSFGMQKEGAAAAAAQPSLFEQFQSVTTTPGRDQERWYTSELENLFAQKYVDACINAVVTAIDAYDSADKASAAHLDAAFKTLMQILAQYAASHPDRGPRDDGDYVYPQHARIAGELLTRVKRLYETLHLNDAQLSEGTQRLLKRSRTTK